MAGIDTMIDFLKNFECWILYGAVIFASVNTVYYVYLRLIGRRTTKPLLASLFAIVLGFTGWAMIGSIVDTSKFLDVAGSQTSTVYMLMIGACFVSAVVYYATGKFEAGSKHILSTFLLILFLMLVPAIFNAVGVDPSSISLSSIKVTVTANPVLLSSGGGKSTIHVSIDDSGGSSWDYVVKVDGAEAISGSTASKNFDVDLWFDPVTNGSKSHAITVVVWRSDDSLIRGVGGTCVVVGENRVPDMVSWFLLGLQAVAGKTLDKFLDILRVPIDPMYKLPMFSENDEFMKMYGWVSGIALVALILYIAINLVWVSFTSERIDQSVIENLKEALVVLAVIVLGPYVYNLSAGILNVISTQIASYLNVGAIYAGLAGWIVCAVLTGYFIPLVAHFMALVLISFILLIALGFARYLLIEAIVTVSPILAVSYLHPAFRGAVRQFLGLLASLMLASPVIAGMLYALTINLSGPFSIGQFIFAPFFVVLLPIGFSMGLTGNVMGGGSALARVGSYLTLGLVNRLADRLGSVKTVSGASSGSGGGSVVFSNSPSNTSIRRVDNPFESVGIDVINSDEGDNVYAGIADTLKSYTSNPAKGLRKLGQRLSSFVVHVPSSSFGRTVTTAIVMSERVNAPWENILADIRDFKREKGLGSINVDDILLANALSKGVGVIKKDSDYMKEFVRNYADEGRLKYILVEGDSFRVEGDAQPKDNVTYEGVVEGLKGKGVGENEAKAYAGVVSSLGVDVDSAVDKYGDAEWFVSKLEDYYKEKVYDALAGDREKALAIKNAVREKSDLRSIRGLDEVRLGKVRRVMRGLSDSKVGNRIKTNLKEFSTEIRESLYDAHRCLVGPVWHRRRKK